MIPELPHGLAVALEVIAVLEELDLPYHLGGSYASSIHGIPRQTQDVDLVVEMGEGSAPVLAGKLRDRFYLDEESIRLAVRRKSSCNLIHLDTGLKIDLFVRGDDPFDREELARARPLLVQTDPERSVVVKSPEDTLLRKLQWYRLGGESSDRQWNDVVGIARTQAQRLDLDYLRLWANHLAVEDLLDRVLEQRAS
jgi:hypothetical protein